MNHVMEELANFLAYRSEQLLLHEQEQSVVTQPESQPEAVGPTGRPTAEAVFERMHTLFDNGSKLAELLRQIDPCH
jgi:hypothetical protein